MEHLLALLKELLSKATWQLKVVTLAGLGICLVQAGIIYSVGQTYSNVIVCLAFTIGTCMFWSGPLFVTNAISGKLRKEDELGTIQGAERGWQSTTLAEIYIGACLLGLFFTGRVCYVYLNSKTSGGLYSLLVEQMMQYWVPTACIWIFGAKAYDRLFRK